MIKATPEAVWALVTDLPRMGEWSPENNGGTWLKGATAAAVGAKFKGKNSNGKRSWSTVATVTELDAPRSFAFNVKAGGLKIATWRYDLAPADGGVAVTETWNDPRSWIAMRLGGLVSNVQDRAKLQPRRHGTHPRRSRQHRRSSVGATPLPHLRVSAMYVHRTAESH